MLKDGRRLVNDWLMGPVSAKNGLTRWRRARSPLPVNAEAKASFGDAGSVPDTGQSSTYLWRATPIAGAGRHQRPAIDGTKKISFRNPASLLRHHFIDPDARYERIAPRHLFCVIKAAGAHQREAGDGLKSHWQVLDSCFRDFSASTEMTAHVDDMVFHCLEPLALGCHDFRRGFFKSVVQQDKLLHCHLLDVG
jgi:hypothetical protein